MEENNLLDINIQNVTKSFGNFTAVSNIDFSVKQGQITGLLGPNGAGKTTLIKMLMNQSLPTDGKIEVFDQKLDSHSTNYQYIMNQIGYVPDTPILYEGLTPREMLGFIGRLYRMSPHAILESTDELVRLLKMEEFQYKLIRNFSLGMKKKVSIACALIHSPRLLILDELTNGLDPRVSREVKNLINDLNSDRNITCLMTSHILDVVEELAHEIIIIDKGELIASGNINELKLKYGIADVGNLEDVFIKATN